MKPEVKYNGSKIEITNAPALSEKNITLRIFDNGSVRYYSERLGTIKRDKNILTIEVEKDSKGKQYLLKHGMDALSEGVLSEDSELNKTLKKD